MPNFVDIDFAADQQSLLDLVTASLTASGWTPDDADPEVVFAEAVAAIAAQLSDAIGQVPSAVFRKFGTDLLQVTYQPAAPATALVTVTLRAPATGTPFTLDAGTQFQLGGGFYFELVDDLTIPVGSSSATSVELRALLDGADSNGISGSATPVNQIAEVSSVTIQGVTGAGADAEDDADYQNRLRDELTLLTPRPITESDFAVMARNVPEVPVGRSTAIDGYNPFFSQAFTGDTTTGSVDIANVSIDPTNTIPAGSAITGPGIPSGATVQGVTGGTPPYSVSVDLPATATATGVALTATGSYDNERTIAVYVTAEDGTALDTSSKSAINAYLQSKRELNFVVNVLDPSYNTVAVDYTVALYPGFDETATIAAINDAVSGFLSPLLWGSQGQAVADVGGSAPPAWANDRVVRWNKLVGVIENIGGVDYVATLSINGGAEHVDFVMSGPAPLPEAGTITGAAA